MIELALYLFIAIVLSAGIVILLTTITTIVVSAAISTMAIIVGR